MNCMVLVDTSPSFIGTCVLNFSTDDGDFFQKKVASNYDPSYLFSLV